VFLDVLRRVGGEHQHRRPSSAANAAKQLVS
jgi:hypothetical protein